MNYPIVPESRVLGHLEKLFGVRGSKTVEDFFEAMDAREGNHFPRRATDIMWINESIPVIPCLEHPTRGSRLLAHLQEFPDCLLLVNDNVLPSSSALWLVILAPDADEVPRWLGLQAQPNLRVNHYDGEVLIAAPVASFV